MPKIFGVDLRQLKGVRMDMKDRMIEAYERGECSYDGAYDHVRESLADSADQRRKAERESGPDRESADRTAKEGEQ